ncbi:hypothetical protein SRHO_G00064120 [Serrasalmus rhombeus]
MLQLDTVVKHVLTAGLRAPEIEELPSEPVRRPPLRFSFSVTGELLMCCMACGRDDILKADGRGTSQSLLAVTCMDVVPNSRVYSGPQAADSVWKRSSEVGVVVLGVQLLTADIFSDDLHSRVGWRYLVSSGKRETFLCLAVADPLKMYLYW